MIISKTVLDFQFVWPFLKFREIILTLCLTILSTAPVLLFSCMLPTFHSKSFVDILTMLAQSRILDFYREVNICLILFPLVNSGIFLLSPCTKYNLLALMAIWSSFFFFSLLCYATYSSFIFPSILKAQYLPVYIVPSNLIAGG